MLARKQTTIDCRLGGALHGSAQLRRSGVVCSPRARGGMEPGVAWRSCGEMEPGVAWRSCGEAESCAVQPACGEMEPGVAWRSRAG